MLHLCVDFFWRPLFAAFAIFTAHISNLNLTSLNPTPATCHKRKQKMPCNFKNVALQKLHCNIRFSAALTSFYQNHAATNEKLHYNIEKTASQESGAFLPLSCVFQAPTFRLPRVGPAEQTRTPKLTKKNWRRNSARLLSFFVAFFAVFLAIESPPLSPLFILKSKNSRRIRPARDQP